MFPGLLSGLSGDYRVTPRKYEMDAAMSKKETEVKETSVRNNDEVIKLAMNLIDCESLSGYEQPMVEILKSWLESRGWTVHLQEVSPQQSTPNGKARHNIYAHRPGIPISREGAGPRVLFNSHIDTVRAFSLMYYLTLSYVS